jgi:hypothetical protein
MDEFRAEAQKSSGKTLILSIRQRGGRSDDFSEIFSVAVPAAPASAPPKK